MQGIYMKEIDPLVLRGVGWVGKAALFCLGLLAMVALIIVTVVLTAVMLTVTALPNRHRPPCGRGEAEARS